MGHNCMIQINITERAGNRANKLVRRKQQQWTSWKSLEDTHWKDSECRGVTLLQNWLISYLKVLQVKPVCTLVYMRRRNPKRLWPICHPVQSLNPQCSQSHFHPLWRNGILSTVGFKFRKQNTSFPSFFFT